MELKEIQDLLNEKLNSITLNEIRKNPSLQESLQEIRLIIDDFIRLINPKFLSLVIKQEYKREI